MWKKSPPRITNGSICDAICVTGTIAMRHFNGA